MTYVFSLKVDNPEAETILVYVDERDQLDVRAEFVSLLS